MTAEIVIMNRQAIALAADSAVTVTYPDGQKIYNSVNKLFTLSKYAPVGVMIYGVADLTGIPWETIIKSFRRDLGDKRFPHLRDYADMLVKYINEHKVMFTDVHQEQQLFASVSIQFRDILRSIDEKAKDFIEKNGSIDESDLPPIVLTCIREAYATWTKAKGLPGVPTDHAARIRSKWKKNVESAIGYIFQDLPLTAISKKRLISIGCFVFTKALFPDNVSGVVVAGFGEEEYLPSAISFDMEGVLLNYLKFRENLQKSTAITADFGSAMIPFAQGEMVSLFMEGVDPTFRYMIAHALDHFTEHLTDSMVATLDISSRREKSFRRRAKEAAEEAAKKYIESLSAYSYKYHVEPVVSAVANLPKDELAATAESLVSLTSFKRRVTHDPETVGGPIDVAVISKGDGFVWIKRKHYFKPELNHQFFANYYNVPGGDGDV